LVYAGVVFRHDLLLTVDELKILHFFPADQDGHRPDDGTTFRSIEESASAGVTFNGAYQVQRLGLRIGRSE
jgi:hypothetical protein